MWTDERALSTPVEDPASSTLAVPEDFRTTMRIRTVVPGIHTAYDFYERIYLDA